MARFEAQKLALDAVAALGPLVGTIAQHDRDLASQLRRAGSSLPLNVAEGARREGRDRLQHYRIAAGSAAEARSALQVARAWGYIGGAEADAPSPRSRWPRRWRLPLRRPLPWR
jgi:four helix bundle protein